MAIDFLRSSMGPLLDLSRLEEKRVQLSSLSVIEQFQYGALVQTKSTCALIFLRTVPALLVVIPAVYQLLHFRFTRPERFK